jgi:phage shock protein A
MFISSLFRFIGSLFGLCEGATERATDKMLASSADTIRAQFRKTREDWTREYSEMRNAVAQLQTLRDERFKELTEHQKQYAEISQKMDGAITLYRQSKDETCRTRYAALAEQRDQVSGEISAIQNSLTEQDVALEQYKEKLRTFQDRIEALKKEEAETVADIVSSRKINELNNKLAGLSTDTQTKNLEAIREARSLAVSTAKLSATLSSTGTEDIDKKLLSAGATSKHMSEFEALTALDRIVTVVEEIPLLDASTPSLKTEKSETQGASRSIDNLFP